MRRARYLRVSGFKGLFDPGSPEAAVGIVAQQGQLLLAADPRINSVGHNAHVDAPGKLWNLVDKMLA